ncbi:MAG: hypothetical protein MUO57_04885 [Anaerolineales bacterium]|nr:hypothetical protein [Anaerolineales bacterium]
MKLKTMLVIKAVVCLVFGILFLLVTGPFMAFFGVTLDSGGIFVARLYGASLIGNLLLTWFARNDAGSEALRAAVLALFVYDAIGFIVALLAVLSGVMNTLGWAVVGLYLLLTLGFGYFQFMKPSAS